MRIELSRKNSTLPAVHLAPHQTLKVTDGAGSTVTALEGSVWITEENLAKDVVLEAGSTYRLREPGLALINAIGGEAAVSFA